MGTTALIAEVSGIEKEQHVKHKLAEMISIAELVFASGVAAAYNATKASSGTMIPKSCPITATPPPTSNISFPSAGANSGASPTGPTST